MSRRTNGTNRAGALLNASRYTGYGKPKKKTASLAELNGQINKNINSLIISRESGGCNEKKKGTSSDELFQNLPALRRASGSRREMRLQGGEKHR